MQLSGRKVTVDESPFAVLYLQNAQALLIYLRRHVASKEDAEDLLLDVFLAALESEVVLRLGTREQQAWLHRVARNKLIDYHRRALRRPAQPLDDAEDLLFDDEERTPEQVALRQEDHTLLREHLATLPELQREVVRLRFVHGLRCQEIGALLNKSDGAVRMLLSRALNVLRRIYDTTKEETYHE